MTTNASSRTADHQLPAGFISVDEQLPPTGNPVLAIRESGTVTARFEILTAKFDLAYRPRNPWIDLGNDPVTNSGSKILGWRQAPELY